MDRTIEVLEEVVVLNKGLNAPNLAEMLIQRFNRTGIPDDNTRAITLAEECYHNLEYTGAHRMSVLDTLASGLANRFDLEGSLVDLNRSVELSNQAAALSVTYSFKRPIILSNLAIHFLTRARRTRSAEDLQNCIITGEKGLSEAGDVNDRSKCLSLLGAAFQLRSRWTGSHSDSNHAIRMYHDALTVIPPLHPDRVRLVNDLTIALQWRFSFTRSIDDINRAVELGEAALTEIPSQHHATHVIVSFNLSSSYRFRAELHKSETDLNRAIELLHWVISSTSKDDPQQCDYLNNLASAYLTRVEWLPNMSDLASIVDLYAQAIQNIPPDHPSFAMYFENLGSAYRKRFDLSASPDDLDQAIAMHEVALKFLPEIFPRRAVILTSLGHNLHDRFLRTQSRDDIIKAAALNEEAVNMSSAAPFVRVTAAARGAAALYYLNNPKRTLNILQAGLHLLPTICPRSLSRAAQHDVVSRYSRFPNVAAELLLNNRESAYNVVYLLELGRGAIASHFFETRTDLQSLKEAHPEHADRFQRLGEEIDSIEPDRILGSVLSSAEVTERDQRRHELVTQLSEALQTIRTLRGFNNFLLGPTEGELKSLATEGPIVVLNVGASRCDALLINTDAIGCLPLPNLQVDQLYQKAKSVQEVLADRVNYRIAQRRMKDLLEWLWDVAVGPVLNELGYRDVPDSGTWPRVWWVPTDVLNNIPLHAAGYHKEDSSQTCMDRVISSYAPTIKSLAHARKRFASCRAGRPIQEIAFISMPQTPVQPDLKHVDVEIANIDSLIPQRIARSHLRNSRKAEVLQQLLRCQVAHVACHGHPDPSDPSQSMLLLEDWQSEPLCVADIETLRLKEAQFIYLNACHAAGSHTPKLVEEGIHLTGACQLAGFSSVVGTLWQISDEYSANVAADVYRIMCQDGCMLDVARVAMGLHQAVRALREQTRSQRGSRSLPDDPLLWAPYIHVGV